MIPAGRLAEIMLARGLHSVDVAAELDVSERTVTRWLAGVGPTANTARRLAAAYGGDWTEYMPTEEDE